MLQELLVEGLAAIDKAEMTLPPGCSALTGETGAGKTLLVAALGLLAGDRADRTLVREGAEGALVEGRFEIPPEHPARSLLMEAGFLESEDPSEIVISRAIPAGDRTGRARVNGRLTTIALLAELGGMTIEIAGQHEHQKLGTPATQRALLDSFAGTQELAQETTLVVRDLAAARMELDSLEKSARERERELDVLRYEIEEIEGAAVQHEESENLRTEASRLEHAAAIGSALDAVGQTLGDESGAAELLDSTASRLEEAAGLDARLKPVYERLRSLATEVADVAQEVRALEVVADPQALEVLRERLDLIGRLKRKYGDTEAAILEYLDRSQARLRELSVADERVEALRTQVQERLAGARDLAAQLSEQRQAAAPRLAAEVENQLGELALAEARFSVSIEDTELYEGGTDRVEFRVAANPGEAPRPVNKVASGGELSRIALALHVVTGTGPARTLVFDEVDAGVGGEAAQAVGRALARLASERDAQVLVVTHLPQVAAFADHQYRVDKRSESGRSKVSVERVEGPQRVEELSRMLAGLPESDRARSHARELLEIAGHKPR